MMVMLDEGHHRQLPLGSEYRHGSKHCQIVQRFRILMTQQTKRSQLSLHL